MQRLLFIACLVPLFYGCSPISQKALNTRMKETERKFQDHAGLSVFDIAKGKSIYSYQDDKYFTPASNTKIFTFYTSLCMLKDSVPGLKYKILGDSLIFWGTGDPGLLYKNIYPSTAAVDFLRSSGKKLYFSPRNFFETPFGPGWAWDDYNDYYSVERSPLPVYGNIFAASAGGDEILISPSFFNRYRIKSEQGTQPGITREIFSNNFTVVTTPGKNFSNQEIPFRATPILTTQLLSDTIHRGVTLTSLPYESDASTLTGTPADTLYKIMMQVSDNFVAEQLLLVCSSVISDSLNTDLAINYAKKNFLNDLQDKINWIDGSGLSRYNLFTPRSIVALWGKIYTKVPRERLFSLLVTGGKPGTLKNYFASGKPYVFGKTGSLSNNLCLSGFLVTKSGKTLIFSFMNSNFTAAPAEIRKNMQEILNRFYEHY